MIQGGAPDPVSLDQFEQEADCSARAVRTPVHAHPVSLFQEPEEERLLPSRIGTEEEIERIQGTKLSVASQRVTVSGETQPQARQVSRSTAGSTARQKGSSQSRSAMMIERAIQDYLQDRRSNNRRPKTLEWHQTALVFFQRYLLNEGQCVLLSQITETECQRLRTLGAGVDKRRGQSPGRGSHRPTR